MTAISSQHLTLFTVIVSNPSPRLGQNQKKEPGFQIQGVRDGKTRSSPDSTESWLQSRFDPELQQVLPRPFRCVKVHYSPGLLQYLCLNLSHFQTCFQSWSGQISSRGFLFFGPVVSLDLGTDSSTTLQLQTPNILTMYHHFNASLYFQNFGRLSLYHPRSSFHYTNLETVLQTPGVAFACRTGAPVVATVQQASFMLQSANQVCKTQCKRDCGTLLVNATHAGDLQVARIVLIICRKL